jgi:3-hydroxypropanoate dehydrogenase
MAAPEEGFEEARGPLPTEATPPTPTAEEALPPTPPAGAPDLDDDGLDVLFRTARTHYKWTDAPVSDHELRRLYDLLKFGPTSANSSPARFVFLRSQFAKQRLLPALSPGNVDKTITAPVVVVVAYDPRFFDHLPHLFPHADARAWFTSNQALATETAFRNGTLQGAYLMLAARAIGLDCGPMSGFDQAIVDRDILADYGWKSNFLVNLGHGEPGELPPRSPRLGFDQACVVL